MADQKTTTDTTGTDTPGKTEAAPSAAKTKAAPSRRSTRRSTASKSAAATADSGPPKPKHPAGTPDPTPDTNTDPVLRVRDPDLAASAAAAAAVEKFDLVGADGRNLARGLTYQAAADEAARISNLTGEQLEIVRAGDNTPAADTSAADKK